VLGRRNRAAPPAVVMGTIDLVRPLGLAGISCVVVSPPDDPARHSRFVQDAIDDGPEVLDRLLAFGRRGTTQSTLFYQRDVDVLLISRNRDRLGDAFRFVVPDGGLVEDLVDKARFQALAARAGLPVPAAEVIDPQKDESAAMPLPPPAIVKPLSRGDAWFQLAGWGKAIEVDSEAAWHTRWPGLAATGSPLLVQRLIPGGEERIESYHVYVDARGEIAGEFTGRKIRTRPAQFGASTALTTTAESSVRDLGRDIVRRIGLRGVAKLDFKRAPDGHLYLLEVNPRFSLWAHLGAAAGVNLPALVHADLTGQTRPPAGHARPGIRWCDLRADASAARDAGVPAWRWARWAWATEAKSGTALDDPMPILAGKVWPRVTGRRPIR
jgi:predicted ATP-grasp superfamily ATP-dependent carboligase